MTTAALPSRLDRLAEHTLREAELRGLKVATAESCTGGLLAALLTDVEGLAHVFERGFVAYAEAAKIEMLEVSAGLIATEGAVSEAAARAMAEGALHMARADAAVAITGYAGPTKEGEEGLVHMAAARTGRRTRHIERHYGACGRLAARTQALEDALKLLHAAIVEEDGRSSR
ncbi:MAG: CinA family protein [Hyphomonadaceae bacterium]